MLLRLPVSSMVERSSAGYSWLDTERLIARDDSKYERGARVTESSLSDVDDPSLPVARRALRQVDDTAQPRRFLVSRGQ